MRRWRPWPKNRSGTPCAASRTGSFSRSRESGSGRTPSCGTPGRQYRNPVSAYPLGDGFVIAVLYGTESNWVRNVMAAGGFTLQTKGRDYQLERPEIITPAQALPAYPALYRRKMRSRGI